MSLHALTLRLLTYNGPAACGPWVRRTDRAADWIVASVASGLLFADGSPDWFDPASAPGARCVKKGHGRSTWRIPVEGETIFVKVMDARRGLAAMADALFGDAVQREWRSLCEVRRRGIAVAEGLAVGVQDGPRRRSVLLTRGARGGCEVRRLAARGAPKIVGRRRAALVRDLARLFAVAHQRGVTHRDPHPGNVFVRLSSANARHQTNASSAPPRAWWIDVHGARVRRGPLSQARSAAALAQFAFGCRRFATRTDRLRFVREYRAFRDWIADDERSFQSSIQRRIADHAARLARHRDRRLLRDGKYFRRLRLGGGWSATVALRPSNRSMPRRTAQDWCPILTRLTAGATETKWFDGTVERDKAPGVAARLRWTLFGSLHRKAFLRSHRLRHRDQTDEFIAAVAEHRTHGIVDRTMLIRASEDTRDLVLDRLSQSERCR